MLQQSLTGEGFFYGKWAEEGHCALDGVCAGVALSLGVYLLVTVLASLLLVKTVLPEAGAFPVLAAGCCLSACLGGLTCTRRSPGAACQCPGVCRRFSGSADRRESALLETDLVAGPGGGLLLLCGAGGGLLAGVLGGRRRRRKGGKRVQPSPEKGKSPLVKFTKNTDLSSCIWEIAAGLAPQQEGERRRQILGRRRFYVYNILFFSVPKAAKERDAL